MSARSALCAAIVVLAACAGSADPAGTTGPDQDVRLVTVFDGDSILVDIDGTQAEVRLVGINAPERDECFGEAARDALTGLLETGPITISPAGDEDRDRFDRLLRYVLSGERLLNVVMLASGHGVLVDVDHPRAAEFATTADTAFAAREGMWAANACGSPGSPDIRIEQVEEDPTGDDYDGEFVLVENDGPTPVDLSGWVLRDTSSVHRYVFPDGLVLDDGSAVRIVTGCAPDQGELAWCADGPVWNNGGDTAILQTADGSVVDRLRYP